MTANEGAATAVMEFCTPGDQPAEERDRMTRHLLNELRDGGVTVELARGADVEQGAKGAEMVEAGKLLLTMAPTALPHLVSVIHDWLGRKSQRTIKVKAPNGFELEATGGMTVAEIEQLFNSLGNGAKAGS